MFCLKPFFIVSLCLLGLGINLSQASREQKTITCATDFSKIDGTEGILVIRHNQSTCGFDVPDEAKNIALKTENLKSRPGESVNIRARESTFLNDLRPPFGRGWIFITVPKAQIIFQSLGNDNGTTEVEFFLDVPGIPIDGDLYNEFQIIPVGTSVVPISLKKSLDDLVFFEALGVSTSVRDLFSQSQAINVTNQSQPFLVRSSVALKECSGTITDKNETSHEINGPEVSKLNHTYKCVNIFSSTIAKDGAHYDVDFANFLDIVDRDDQLSIDDESTSIRVLKSTASDYPKRVISFRGKQLTVIYDSPRVVNPTKIPFKLTVKSLSDGGVVDKAATLSVPTGNTRYELRPQANEYPTLVLDSKFSGSTIKISDGRRALNLSAFSGAPLSIGFNQVGSNMILDLSTKSKSSGTIRYSPAPASCSGVIFDSSGTISMRAKATSCSWLIGGENSSLSISYHDVNNGACLSLYSLGKSESIFSHCNISQTDYIPDFTLSGPAYITLTVPSPGKESRVEASASPVVSQSVKVSTSAQYNISSLNYPSSYAWSRQEEVHPINGLNKSLVVSIAEADLRLGEKVVVDTSEIDDENRLIIGDINVFNRTSKVTVKRTVGGTKDFGSHRGYKVVVTEFQQVLLANSTANQNTLVPTKNSNSLLVRISAPQGKVISRILYNITLASTKDIAVAVVDSRTILGRSVYPEEALAGSTTSDSLLINLRATKAGVMLPKLTVHHSSTACNITVDHVCDNSTRCVPVDKQCKGLSYCVDKSDLMIPCAAGPSPAPKIVERGMGGMAVFILAVLMFTLGSVAAIYGPHVYKSFDNRFRSGQYSSFTSTE